MTHQASDDYAPAEHVAALAAEAAPILGELGLSVAAAHRLLLDRVAQRDPDVLAWLKTAAEHDVWFRAKVQEALDDPRPAIPHDQVEAHFAKRRAGEGEA